MTATLALDAAHHIARITLHSNTIDAATARQLCGFLDVVEGDDDIKVALIRSAGSDLSTGWDLADAWSMYVDSPGGSLKKVPSQRARLVAIDDLWWGPKGLWSRLLHCRKVTVLEARGACHETGLYLTLCSDLTVASHDATFANPRWSLLGVDGDVSLLIASVGLKRAKDLMFCAASWSAAEALSYGLVDACFDGDQLSGEAERLAAMCASIMRDGIVSEKYAVFASLEKLGVGLSFSAATVVGASLSNIHFQPGELNVLREARGHGVPAALDTAAAWLRGDPARTTTPTPEEPT